MRLKRLPDLGYEEEKDKIKVAIMTLAFNNPDMFAKLKERGQAINEMDWVKVHNLERAMIDEKNY